MPSCSVISGWTGREMNLSTLLLCSKPAWFTVPLLSLAFIFWGSNAAGGLSFCIQRVHAFASFLHSCVHTHFLKYRDHFHRCVIWLHDLLASVGWLSTQSLFLTARFCDCMVCTGVVFRHPLADSPPKASSCLPVSVTAWCDFCPEISTVCIWVVFSRPLADRPSEASVCPPVSLAAWRHVCLWTSTVCLIACWGGPSINMGKEIMVLAAWTSRSLVQHRAQRTPEMPVVILITDYVCPSLPPHLVRAWGFYRG